MGSSTVAVAVLVVVILAVIVVFARSGNKPLVLPFSFIQGESTIGTSIDCGGSAPHIKILSAKYGVPDPQPPGCQVADATSAMDKVVAGASTWKWPGYADDIAGDPCPGHPKTFSGTYECTR